MKTKPNFNLIATLRHAKITSSEGERMLSWHIQNVNDNIDSLRNFANRKPGKVADNCNKIADLYQSQLEEVLK